MSQKMRLDSYLKEKYPALSRSLIQKLITNSHVSVNTIQTLKPGTLVSQADLVELDASPLEKNDKEYRFHILYEDENCIVIDKPEGVLTVSKGEYNPESTVYTWLRKQKNYDFPKDHSRGGIVHRLDRGTSGVLICAKNSKTLGYLQKQFQDRSVRKKYLALVSGSPKEESAILELPIARNPKKPQTFKVDANGKSASTQYSIVKNLKNYSLLELKPKTGRTHQLRVHLAYINHPIVGDAFYNGAEADRLYLHAFGLELTLPDGVRKRFEVDMPTSFVNFERDHAVK